MFQKSPLYNGEYLKEHNWRSWSNQMQAFLSIKVLWIDTNKLFDELTEAEKQTSEDALSNIKLSIVTATWNSSSQQRIL